MSRCFGDGDPLYERYHDEEWGGPVADERGLFERMSLEAFQSGLSWMTILRKRETLPRRVRGLRPRARSRASATHDVERLLADAGIVRNRAKIEATIANARATVALREDGGTLRELIWAHRPAPRRGAARRSPTCPRRHPRPSRWPRSSSAAASASSARRRSTR